MIKRIRWFLWYFHRPKSVRDVAKKYYPWKQYRLKTTGQNAILTSIFEDGTISCFCWQDYGGLDCRTLGFGVFGINPNDLVDIEKESNV
jgi:hypothetical protein